MDFRHRKDKVRNHLYGQAISKTANTYMRSYFIDNSIQVAMFMYIYFLLKH